MARVYSSKRTAAMFWMKLNTLLIALSFAAPCSAALTSVDPFTGDFSEGFESFANGEVPGISPNFSGPVPILSGHGILSGMQDFDLAPLYIWNVRGGRSLGDIGVAAPFDGEKGLVLQSIDIPSWGEPRGRFDFMTPVSGFGGYWTHAETALAGGPITLKFFDVHDQLVATESVTYDRDLAGVSEWFGWRSDTPIGAVEFKGYFAGVDGLQVNIVAEPAAATLATTGLMLLVVVRATRKRSSLHEANDG